MTLHIFTSAALNYLPKVRRLLQSIHDFHPEARVTLALADILPEGESIPVKFDQVISVTDLDLPDWPAWTFGHTLVELATAIKPFVLERLLEEPDAKVIYLDPDIVLFDRLDDVLAELDHASIALTPHLVEPEVGEQAILDNEMAALKHGVYNLGFVAVRACETGRAFARWWRQRCEKWCIDDIANGLFTDQRWIDLVPALFPEVTILRSQRLNVAPWNIAHRPISGHDGHYFVGGEKLGFYHFTGFDSGAHAIMADRYGCQSEAVQSLIRDYRAFLEEAARDPMCRYPWAFAAFANGKSIPLAARRTYRSRLDLQQAFRDPYQEPFYRWWCENGADSESPALTRLAPRRVLLDAMKRPRNWPKLIQYALSVWRQEGWSELSRRWHQTL